MSTITGEIKIFSHNDLDGVASPIVLMELIRRRSIVTNFSVTHSSTGKEGTIDHDIIKFLSTEELNYVKHIFITDLTPSRSTLELLEHESKLHSFEWLVLDHHETARWAAKEYPKNVINKQTLSQEERKQSATSVIVDYMEHITPTGLNMRTGFRNVALLAEVVRLYDTWEWIEVDNPFGKIAKSLNDLFYLYPASKRSDLLKECLQHSVEAILEANYEIIEGTKEKEEEYIKNKIDDTSIIDWKGYKVGVVFAEQYISNLGNQMVKQLSNIDFAIVVHGSDGTHLSLRSSGDTSNVGDIAMKYFNGGGHKNAAGGKATKEFLRLTYGL